MDTMYLADLDHVLDRAAVYRLLQDVVTATGLTPASRIVEAEYLIREVRRHRRNLNKIRMFIATCPVATEMEVKI